MDFTVGQGFKMEPCQGIRGIGNQLAQEDLPFFVK